MAFNTGYDKGMQDVRDNAIQGKSASTPEVKDPQTGGTKRVLPAAGSPGLKFKSALSKYKALKKR